MTDSEIIMWLATIGSGLTGIGILRDYLADKRADDQRLRQDVNQALHALRAAAITTRTYMDRRTKGAPKDCDAERNLEQLWYDVYISMRCFDQKLARRFKIKGDYWHSPEDWTDQQVQEAGIGFDQIVREADFLLHQQPV
jgi:hypothetical protein